MPGKDDPPSLKNMQREQFSEPEAPPVYAASKYDHKERLANLYDRALQVDPVKAGIELTQITKLIAPELGILFTRASPGKILQLARKALDMPGCFRVVEVNDGHFDELDVVLAAPEEHDHRLPTLIAQNWKDHRLVKTIGTLMLLILGQFGPRHPE